MVLKASWTFNISTSGQPCSGPLAQLTRHTPAEHTCPATQARGAPAAEQAPVPAAPAAAPDAARPSLMGLDRARLSAALDAIGVKGSVLEKFQATKAAGFEGVEPMGAMNRDEVIAAFKATGLKAASVCDHIHWVKPLSAPDEATRKLGMCRP